MTRTLGAALVLLVTAVLLVGCSAKDVAHAPAIKVDTPAMRTLKSQAGVADCVPSTAPKAKDGLSDRTLPCLGGGPRVDMSRLRGPLVVNYFAQWCGPCRKDLPYYQQFSEKYAGRVGVLGVNWRDTQPRRALELVRTTGVRFPLVADTPGDLEVKGGMPQLVMIDAAGKVVFHKGVAVKSEAELEKLVAENLGVTR